jgi:hypothetical protein
MDPQLEDAVREAAQWAELCRAEHPAGTPPPERLAQLARHLKHGTPPVLAVLLAGNGPELINFLWGAA